MSDSAGSPLHGHVAPASQSTPTVTAPGNRSGKGAVATTSKTSRRSKNPLSSAADGSSPNAQDTGAQGTAAVAHTRTKQKRPKPLFAREVIQRLRAWAVAHADYPYPSETEKRALAAHTGLSRLQISNWMINARRRMPILQRPALARGVDSASVLTTSTNNQIDQPQRGGTPSSQQRSSSDLNPGPSIESVLQHELSKPNEERLLYPYPYPFPVKPHNVSVNVYTSGASKGAGSWHWQANDRNRTPLISSQRNPSLSCPHSQSTATPTSTSPATWEFKPGNTQRAPWHELPRRSCSYTRSLRYDPIVYKGRRPVLDGTNLKNLRTECVNASLDLD